MAGLRVNVDRWKSFVLRERKNIAIIGLSILGGLGATWIIPMFISWYPYDYSVYIEGARMVRAGADPYSKLPYWYPLPIVLFTTLPLSFLPDRFAWAFAFVPLGLLHIRFGRRAVLWWLFFPLLINLAFAQFEGWLILPLFWVLENAPGKASIGILALMFKPAYGLFLVPYRLFSWLRARQWKELIWLLGLGGIMFSAAFLIDVKWPLHWLSAVLRRGDNPELIMRNMTVWAFIDHGGLWFVPLVLLLAVLSFLAVPLLRAQDTRSDVLLALSLFFFPGLNPVSSMMVMPLAKTTTEILVLVVVSWMVAGLDILLGGFGGVYLLIVLAALALRARRHLESKATVG
jgi:hypothetical protein